MGSPVKHVPRHGRIDQDCDATRALDMLKTQGIRYTDFDVIRRRWCQHKLVICSERGEDIWHTCSLVVTALQSAN